MLGVGIPQYEVKSGHARQPSRRMVTHDRRNHQRRAPRFLPGWPFLLLGMSTLSNHHGWVRQVTAWLHLIFVDQTTPRKTEKGTEDFHVAVGNPTFGRRHNYLV